MGASEDEVDALWRELYGEPPAVRADFRTLLKVVVATLPEPPPGAPPQEPCASDDEEMRLAQVG